MPLQTQSQRRRLVALYYLVLLALAVAGLWKPHAALGPMLAQTLVYGGLLGGIRVGGPVKPYSNPGILEGAGAAEELTTLNLSGTPRRFSLFTRLDEREQHERDHAHYLAYRLLRWTVLIVAPTLCFAAIWVPSWLPGHAAVLFWVFVVYLFSLPQSVVLWTEPSPNAAELIPFHST